MIFNNEQDAFVMKERIQTFLRKYMPGIVVSVIKSYTEFSIKADISNHSFEKIMRGIMNEFEELTQKLKDTTKENEELRKENSKIAQFKNEIKILKALAKKTEQIQTVRELIAEDLSLRLCTIDVDFVILSKDKVDFEKSSQFDSLIEYAIIEEGHTSPVTMEDFEAERDYMYLTNNIINDEQPLDITFKEFLDIKESF